MTGPAAWLAAAAILLSLLLLATPARATVGSEVPTWQPLDPLTRTESPLSYNAKWSHLGWSSPNALYRPGVLQSGWGTHGAFPVVNGAYWNPTTFHDANGEAAAIMVLMPPSGLNHYMSLWLNMSTPGLGKNGYELRWGIDPSTVGGAVTVKLLKWVSGNPIQLATLPVAWISGGMTMAIADTGDTVSAWKSNNGVLTEFLTVKDTTYNKGHAGMESAGTGRASQFKAGHLAAQPPIVTAKAASPVKSTEATLSGEVNPRASATTYQFEYGPTTAYGNKAPVPAGAAGSGTANVAVSQVLKGLQPGTTYHYRLTATSAPGTTSSPGMTFTTADSPTVTTKAATALKATEATLNAGIDPNGAATTYQFEYGPTTAYGTKVPISPASAGSGSSPVDVAQTITGLGEGDEYHYRVVATNEQGTTYGADATLETPLLPDATTESAEAVDDEEAILTGTVEPNGSDATYQFEYGPTTAYGSVVPSAQEEVAKETDLANASEAIAGLAADTTYHYRIVSRSRAGTVFGADRTLTTTAASAPPTGILPNDFHGLMFSGNWPQTITGPEMNAVGQSGARTFRLQVHQSISQSDLDAVFRQAADRGVRILPYFEIGWPTPGEWPAWKAYIESQVARYGPNGEFWQPGGGYGGTNPLPAVWWEIGNEPNLGKNRGTVHAANTPYSPAMLKEYGDTFEGFSQAVEAGAAKRGAGGAVRVLLSALFTTGPTGCDAAECHISAVDFINGMGRKETYDGISVHPYAFKVGNPGHAPTNDAEVKDLVAKVKANLKKVHEAAPGKPLWVTELGFPVASDDQDKFPSVTEAIQAKLITASFQMLEDEHLALNIDRAFLWNIRDNPAADIPTRWEWHSGLRRASGTYRKASWQAFVAQTGGNLNWPRKPKNAPKKHVIRWNGADITSTINPYGSETTYWVKYGPGPSSESYGSFTTPQSAGFGEIDVDKQTTLTGLQPATKYHYRVVAKNENEEREETADLEFETPPSSSTSVGEKRILHGPTGYLWAHGRVKEGGIKDESLPGLANVHVHIKFFRNGAFKKHVDVITDGQGYYETGYVPLGNPGAWEVRADFPGGGNWLSSSSDQKEFIVRDGVQIRAQHSGACWDVFNAGKADHAAIMHGACGDPKASQNQVFTLVPQGDGSTLQLIARHSGRCVDVVGGSPADGSGLQQYSCMAGWQNQLFREAWSGNWLAYVAEHSKKCVDVTGANPGWTHLQQWTCNAASQQAFKLEPVDSNPIPTEVFLTPSPILHGNGQYGNWGLATFKGHLKAGAYSMANRVARIQVEKIVGGQWTPNDELPLTVNPDGSYRFNDYGLAPGIFRVRAVFAGGTDFGGSESAWHQFSIWQANRLVARHSGKCLSLSNNANQNVNGQKFLQWDCAPGASFGDGQTFWFWPIGNNVYEITVISKGRCLDISGAENGSRLTQQDCHHGPNQRFRVIEIAGQPGWYAIQPVHQDRCLDVLGGGTGNGTEVGQWDCNWAGQQQWAIHGVVSG